MRNWASSTRTQSTRGYSSLILAKISMFLVKTKSVSLSGPMRVRSLVPFFVSVAGLITQTFIPRSS